MKLLAELQTQYIEVSWVLTLCIAIIGFLLSGFMYWIVKSLDKVNATMAQYNETMALYNEARIKSDDQLTLMQTTCMNAHLSLKEESNGTKERFNYIEEVQVKHDTRIRRTEHALNLEPIP